MTTLELSNRLSLEMIPPKMPGTIVTSIITGGAEESMKRIGTSKTRSTTRRRRD
jgi:hypothetical protein